MKMPAAKLLVLVGEKFACIKIIGRANFTSSIDFKTLVNELRQKGYRYFVIDLSECVLMDSTFLGVLAGFGLKMNGASSGQGDGKIELSNPNARVAELLELIAPRTEFKAGRAAQSDGRSAHRGLPRHSCSHPGESQPRGDDPRLQGSSRYVNAD